MEKQLSILNKLSKNLLGVSLFEEVKKTKFQVSKYFLFVIFVTSFIMFGLHTIIFNTTVDYHAKLKVICAISGASTELSMFIIYWHNEEQFQLIIKWIQERYLDRKFKLIDDVSKVDYAKCSTFLWKIMKIFITIYTSSIVILLITPIFIASMDYPTPIIIPGTNSSKPVEFTLNYTYQSFPIIMIMIFLFIYDLIFIFITSHILTEIKVMHQVMGKIGDREEVIYLRQLKTELDAQLKSKHENIVVEKPKPPKNQRELDLELLNEIYEELTNEPPTIFAANLVPGPSGSNQPKTSTRNLEMEQLIVEHFDAIHEILFDHQESSMIINKTSSSEILKHVIVMHNDILGIINTTNSLYSISIFMYEVLMVLLHAYTFASFYIDRVTMLTILPIMVSFTVQYFCISLASAKIQDGLEDVGTAIYDSKWYWMSVSDQKTMFQILNVATKSKSLRLGFFADANLERFTDATHFSYDICLMIKFFMKKH